METMLKTSIDYVNEGNYLMTIGEKLKKVRLGLGLNQTQMAAGIVNRSFYSRIESNQTTVNAADLIKILNKHNISVVAFMKGFGNTRPIDEFYQDEVTHAFFAKNIMKLQELHASSKIRNIQTKQITSLLIAELEDRQNNFSVEIAHKLKNSIFQSGEWDPESLWVFSMSMGLYDLHDLQGLVESVFSKYQSKSVDERTLRLIANIAVGYLAIIFNYAHMDYEIVKTIGFLEKLPSTTVITLQKLLGSYFKAIYNKKYDFALTIKQLIKDSGYDGYIELEEFLENK